MVGLDLETAARKVGPDVATQWPVLDEPDEGTVGR